jgi:ribose transport system substrate-binding protein
MSAFWCRLRLRALAGVCAALLVSGALAACGGDDAEEASPAPRADDAAESVAAAEEAVERGYEGTDRPLPDSGPEANEDLNVWIIPCTMQSPGCGAPAQGAAEAAKEIGWEARIADGKLDPNVQANLIRNAISAGADAIITVAIPCDNVPAALQAARAADVKLFGVYTRDCEEPLFDAEIEYGEGIDELAIDWQAPAIAHYVIAKTGGEAEIIQLTLDDGGSIRDIGAAFAATIEEDCPNCVIHEAPFTFADVGQDKLQSLTAAALTRYPEANVVMAPVDGVILLGAGAAVGEVTAQGREILLTGLEGFQPNLEMIAAGGPQDVAAGDPGGWHGWAAIDGVNRLFAGEPQVDAGIGYQLIDKDHPSPSTPYEGNERSLGWKDNYRRIWGVTGSG